MSRGRVAVALAEGERKKLEEVAHAREMPLARVVGELVTQGISRVYAEIAEARWIGTQGAERAAWAALDRDIHWALQTPGVVSLLLDPDALGPDAAVRALNFLVDVAAWLGDPRTLDQRPPAPALARTPISARRSGPISRALDRVGGADGRTVYFAGTDGPASVSDKQTLLDMPAAGGAEVGDDDQ